MTPLRHGTVSAGGCLICIDHWKRILGVRRPGLGPVSSRSRHVGTACHRGSRHFRGEQSDLVTHRHRLMYAPVLKQGLAWRSCHRAFLTEVGHLAQHSSTSSYRRLSTHSGSITVAADPAGTDDRTHARFTVRCVHGTAGERRIGNMLGRLSGVRFRTVASHRAAGHLPTPRITLVCSTYDVIITQVGLPHATARGTCLLYTSPSPRDRTRSRMPSSA